MTKDTKFMDTLSYKLQNMADEHIKHNLLVEFYEQIDTDGDLLGDRKWASMSDIKEIRDAFNKFYNLTSTDEEYLN